MSPIPKTDPELPVDQKAETAAEQYRAARFEDVMLCLVSLEELVEALPTTNDDDDIGRQHRALMNIKGFRQGMIRMRDGP